MVGRAGPCITDTFPGSSDLSFSRTFHALGRQKSLDHIRRRGTSKEVALELFAATAGQELRLLSGLDPLCHHREPEAVSQRHRRGHRWSRQRT